MNKLRTSGHRVAGFLKKPWLSEMFAADLRSLALFRMALGLIVLLDLSARVGNLRAHYSDAGVLPREDLLANLNEWRWSINLMNGTVGFQALVFLIAATAAMLLILGFKTRLMSILLWGLVISIQVRNPFLSSGADTLIRMLLFWAMFLPLGAKWALDARSPGSSMEMSPRPVRSLSFGTAGLFLQIAAMYVFTAILKSGPAWTEDGTALYYATGAGHVTRGIADTVHQFPDQLLRAMTYGTLAIEFAAPVLLFSPIRTAAVRVFAVIAFMMLHLGIFLVMDVGVFSWASALCMVSFLPTRFWDVWLPQFVASLRRRFPVVRRPLAGALQNVSRVIPRSVRPTQLTRTDARRVSGADHDVSDHARQENPKSLSARATSGYMRASIAGNLIAAASIVFILLWNIATVSAFSMPRETHPVAYGVGLYQNWSMFAPQPPQITQWYVVRGVLENGQEVDLVRPIVYDQIDQVAFVSWDRPDDIVNDHYRDKYWRKYLEAIGKSGRSTERLRFAAYACRTWNGYYDGDTRLTTVEIYRMTQRTLPEGQVGEINRRLIDDFTCT